MPKIVYDDIQIMDEYLNNDSVITSKSYVQHREIVPQIQIPNKSYNGIPFISQLKGTRDFITLLFRFWDFDGLRPTTATAQVTSAPPTGGITTIGLAASDFTVTLAQAQLNFFHKEPGTFNRHHYEMPWNASIILGNCIRFRLCLMNNATSFMGVFLDSYQEIENNEIKNPYDNLRVRNRMFGRYMTAPGIGGSTNGADTARNYNITFSAIRNNIIQTYRLDNQFLFGAGSSQPVYFINFIYNNEHFLYEIFVRTGSRATTLAQIGRPGTEFENGLNSTVMIRRII